MGNAFWDNQQAQISNVAKQSKQVLPTFTPPAYQQPEYLSNLKAMAGTPLNVGTSYQAKDYSGALPEFDAVRQHTQQALTQQHQGNQDALQRRFAAMGGLNSGAYVKAGEREDQSAAENSANAMNNIGFQESQQRRALQQQESQKEFQSSEAKAGRAYDAQKFGFDANSKIAGLEMNSEQFQHQKAVDAFNAAMARYQTNHSGDFLGIHVGPGDDV